jgi:hypothetical protein
MYFLPHIDYCQDYATKNLPMNGQQPEMEYFQLKLNGGLDHDAPE